MTQRLLATLKDTAPARGETTNSHEWWFSDHCEYSYQEGTITVFDPQNAGNPMRPYWLVIPLRNYDEIKMVEKE